MTTAQQQTVKFFEDNARETGATVEVIEDEFGVMIQMDDDGAIMQWTVQTNGNAELL